MTFFRVRTPIDLRAAAGSAAEQLLIAHAAIADPARGALLHDERVQRALAGIGRGVDRGHRRAPRPLALRARCGVGPLSGDDPCARLRVAVHCDPDAASAAAGTRRFFAERAPAGTGEPLLQPAAARDRGDTAIGRQLRQLRRARRGSTTSGRAACSTPKAAGWDWIGMNLDDGRALTAFEIRPTTPGPAIYRYASLRADGGPVRTFGPDEVRFETLASWRSPRTGAVYPVARRLTSANSCSRRSR